MKRNGKKSRKIRKLIITCTLSAVVLIVSTYTWFIGMQTVSVNPFEIEIATTEGLFLSMDGENWVYNMDVVEAAKTAYTGNTNTFAPNGLLPISSVGDLDSSVSRMKLFEKGSLTTSPGGYRLLASRVDNYSDEVDAQGVKTGKLNQGNGYVAFDLFIKNLSGVAYYTENEPLNEEAIYLTVDSSVNVKTSGASDDQLKTGIENSVRVAFAQIGRVEATIGNSSSELSLITSMDCDGDATNSKYPVTGICRNAQIWEPNDTKHVNNAISWYQNSCLERTGAVNNLPSSYKVLGYDEDEDGNLLPAAYCYAKTGDKVKANTALPTYAISRVLTIDDNVDVYDGSEYNTYTENTNTYANYLKRYDSLGDNPTAVQKTTEDNKFKLVNYPYFTDTNKVVAGTNRPQFMTLAPNSITKVRVYIWLEGQDIDNYDFAQLGKTISVNFGFTKERYTAADIPGYNGPDLVTSDNADIVTPDKNA